MATTIDPQANLATKSETAPLRIRTLFLFLIGNRQAEVAAAIAPLLSDNKSRPVSERELSELIQRLKPRLVRNAEGKIVTNRYVVLRRKVPVRTLQETNQLGTLQETEHEPCTVERAHQARGDV